jgi:hypothetical protein
MWAGSRGIQIIINREILYRGLLLDGLQWRQLKPGSILRLWFWEPGMPANAYEIRLATQT